MNRDGVVIGLSGGLDSAVIVKLCVLAVGKKNVKVLILPEKDSNKLNIQDALNYAKLLGVKYKKINITPFEKKFRLYHSFILNCIPLLRSQRNRLTEKMNAYYEKKTGTNFFESSLAGIRGKKFSKYLRKVNAYYRVKHRIRMLLLYKYAELENRMVVGAANKTEKMIGFFVKHGCDHASDIMPILNLYKTQVRLLAKYLDIPSIFLDKQPSPDIVPGVIDERVIGIKYELLDKILFLIENKKSNDEISDVLDIDESKVDYVKSLLDKSEHMRKVYDMI